MITIDQLLNEYSEKQVNSNYSMFCYLKISRSWSEIMGLTLSRVSMPSYYGSETLTITVIDSAWAQELMMKQKYIFKNIEKKTGIVVSNLRTRVGEVALQADNEDLTIEKTRDTFLTDSDIVWIEDVALEASIEDEKLMGLFRAALGSVCKK